MLPENEGFTPPHDEMGYACIFTISRSKLCERILSNKAAKQLPNYMAADRKNAQKELLNKTSTGLKRPKLIFELLPWFLIC
jgi:hypothetical protein